MRQHYLPWFRPLPHFATWTEEMRRYWTDPKQTRHYNKAGEPISLLEWCLLFEDMEYRRVAYTELGDGSYLSTVWLGLDHGFNPRRSPRHTFETMQMPEQYAQERWDTEGQALAGHERLLAEVRAKLAEARRLAAELAERKA